MTFFQAIFIALVQGATELFPVSSLGHAVILPGLLGWDVDQKAASFLPFLVVLHLGTSLALLLYFWRDWLGFAQAVLGRGDATTVTRERKIFTLVCVATAPAIVLGFALEHIVRGFFGSPALAAAFLIANGFILFVGEKLRRRQSGDKRLDEISWKAALAIGACQALALIPGISRSGATMVGGVLARLTHQEAARFSFLLATPVIAGAGVLEVPKLLKAHEAMTTPLSTVIVAGIVAGVVAYLSIVALMHYFKKNEIEALNPFAWYCWCAGTLALICLLRT